MCSGLPPPRCFPADCLFLLHHNNTTDKGCKWGELGLNWGPDVVGLSVGSQQQPFPLGELPRGRRGDRACARPSDNQHSREGPTPRCYCCLLLFIFRPHLREAVTLQRWHSVPVEMDVCFLSPSLFLRPGMRTDSSDETNADNAARTEAEGAGKKKKLSKLIFVPVFLVSLRDG